MRSPWAFQPPAGFDPTFRCPVLVDFAAESSPQLSPSSSAISAANASARLGFFVPSARPLPFVAEAGLDVVPRPRAEGPGGGRAGTADVESNEARVDVDAFDGANVLGPSEGVPSEGAEPIAVERSVVMSCTQFTHQNCGGGAGGWDTRTFRLMEDIAQPARAPAAPVALDMRSPGTGAA